MTRSNLPRSAHKPVGKHEVIFSPVLPPVTAATGTKRRRDNSEDEDDEEDAFYGRRLVKSRSKGVKTFERKNIRDSDPIGTDSSDEEGQVTPTRTLAIEGSGKRLKFDPEIHDIGLEIRLLTLQQNDNFKNIITPRKKAPKGTYEVNEKDKARARHQKTAEYVRTSTVPRKIATPKISKPKKQVPVTQVEKSHGSEDKGSTVKPITVPISTDSAYGRSLSRLIYPASNRAQPRTVENSFPGLPTPIKSSKAPTKPSFELSGDAHMKRSAAQREERRKRKEETEKQKEEAKKQQQLQERFKIHTEKNTAKKDQQQGPVPASSRAPTIQNRNLFSPPVPVTSTKIDMTAASGPGSLRSLNSRRLTLDEVDQQLHNENELVKKKAEEAVLRVRQEAAEKGQESARLWAEQMKSKAIFFSNGETS